MTPADMAALHAACFTVPKPWSADSFAALLADRTCLTLTAPQGAALAVFRCAADEAELLTIATRPDCRGQGLARALVLQGFDDLRGRGVMTCFLEVAASNPVALALYDRLGFVRAGLRKGYYTLPGHLPQDALVLRIALA
ncbi:MAG: GNAT family N-acetyltransferase [Roseinatronobacter sp.]